MDSIRPSHFLTHSLTSSLPHSLTLLSHFFPHSLTHSLTRGHSLLPIVQDGHGRNHLKKNAFGPPTCKDDADRCLRVLNRPRAGENAKDLLCLSFGSAEEKEHVKRALARVIQTTKHWSHRLVPEPSGK